MFDHVDFADSFDMIHLYKSVCRSKIWPKRIHQQWMSPPNRKIWKILFLRPQNFYRIPHCGVWRIRQRNSNGDHYQIETVNFYWKSRRWMDRLPFFSRIWLCVYVKTHTHCDGFLTQVLDHTHTLKERRNEKKKL